MLGDEPVRFDQRLRPKINSNIIALIQIRNQHQARGQRTTAYVEEGMMGLEPHTRENVKLILNQLVPAVLRADETLKPVLLSILGMNPPQDGVAKPGIVIRPCLVLCPYQRVDVLHSFIGFGSRSAQKEAERHQRLANVDPRSCCEQLPSHH